MAAGLTRTVARVTMTVELQLSQGWEASCTLEQVYNQAARDARAELERGHTNGMRVVDTKVVAIMAAEERK